MCKSTVIYCCLSHLLAFPGHFNPQELSISTFEYIEVKDGTPEDSTGVTHP